MTSLSRATNQVVQEFLSRTIDNFARALIDGQHIEYSGGRWTLFDRGHHALDADRRLSELLKRNYSYNTLRAVK